MRSAAAIAALVLLVAPPLHAQDAMFRGDAAHRGVAAGAAPRQFHRVKWVFPTGARVVSSPVWHAGQ